MTQDGTLCNIYHRQHYIRSKPKNWKAFYEANGDDLVHEFCRDILFVLEDRAQVVKMWREQGLSCLQVAEGNF